MADNVVANPGAGGATFATDDDGTAQHPYTKLEWGADNTFTKVSSGASALPIQDGGNSVTVDNGGTFVVQENGAALTSLQLIDDVVNTDDTSTHATGTSKGVLLMAAATPTDAAVDANDIGALAMTTSRQLKVDASGVAVPVTDNGGNLSIDDGGNVITVDGSGSAGTAAAGVVTIQGIASMTAVQVGDNAGSLTVDQSTASNLNAQVVGAVAHDASTSVNPVQIGLRAETSPKGITLVADGDVTHAYGDADGLQIVKLATSGADLLSERVSNTDGASTAFTNFSAVASTFNYVTAITVFRTDSASTLSYIDFRDGTGGSILYSVPLPPTGGATVNGGGVPLFKTSSGTALAYDVSAALTTVYISVTGYQSKV